MKPWIVATALTFGALVSACASGTSSGEGKLAADFGGSWVNHPDTSLSALRGKVVFVEIWRTW